MRTQIYLEEAQEKALAARARSEGRTKSALIREAIDQYVTAPGAKEARRTSFRDAIRAAAGSAPYLPDGAEYVKAIRSLDQESFEMLERRSKPSRGGSG